MYSSQKKDKIDKILILGDSEVGKFSFIIRYVDNDFLVNYCTHIGIDYRLKYIQLDSGEKIRVQLWHIPGQERLLTIAKNYYKASHGILLLYDITRQNSFDKIRKLIQIIKEESNKNTIIFLIGNKIDKNRDRKITTEQGQKLAEEYKIPFFEVSAKSGENVNEVFKALYNKINKAYIKIQEERGEKLGCWPGNKERNKCIII